MSRIELPQRDDLVVERTSPAPPSATPATKDPKRPPRRRTPLTSGITASVLWTFAAVTVLALWFVFHALVLTSLETHGHQSRLRARFREELGLATAPIDGKIKPGRPVARLDLGLEGLHSLIVVEGTTPGDLARGPGHKSDSPLPGQPGVSYIFGRSVTYGAPFRAISSLDAGDKIKIVTGQGVFTYRVERFRRPGDLLPPPLAVSASRLVLVTSEASGWRRGWAPDHMVFLDAILDGQTQLPTKPGPTAIPVSAQEMRGDPSVLLQLVFWLQALALVSAGLAWAWVRWGRRQILLLGLPVAVALLWGATGAALRLLPNLI